MNGPYVKTLNIVEPAENMAELPKKDWVRPTGRRSFIWDHFKEHYDENRVKCDHCQITFKKHNCTTMLAARHLKNMHYITHRKRIVSDSNHTNTKVTMKKFACKLCNYKACQSRSLNRHVKAVHAQIEDHVCNVCDKSLSCKEALERHVSILHSGQAVNGLDDKSSHECETCGSFFSSKASRIYLFGSKEL